MGLLVNWIIAAIAVVITSYLIPGVEVAGFGTALVVALVLGVMNALVRPLLVLLTLPVTLVTLGLFLFVINALMVLITARLVEGFRVDGFWVALLFSLVLTAVVTVLEMTFGEKNGSARRLP